MFLRESAYGWWNDSDSGEWPSGLNVSLSFSILSCSSYNGTGHPSSKGDDLCHFFWSNERMWITIHFGCFHRSRFGFQKILRRGFFFDQHWCWRNGLHMPYGAYSQVLYGQRPWWSPWRCVIGQCGNGFFGRFQGFRWESVRVVPVNFFAGGGCALSGWGNLGDKDLFYPLMKGFVPLWLSVSREKKEEWMEGGVKPTG